MKEWKQTRGRRSSLKRDLGLGGSMTGLGIKIKVAINPSL